MRGDLADEVFHIHALDRWN